MTAAAAHPSAWPANATGNKFGPAEYLVSLGAESATKGVCLSLGGFVLWRCSCCASFQQIGRIVALSRNAVDRFERSQD